MKKILMCGGLHRAFKLLLVVSFGVALSACGGGGGGVSSLTPTPTYTVTGSVVAGIVRGAEVSVYQIVDGQRGVKIKTGTTQADGTYAIGVGSYSGPVLVVTTGGVYTDESTGLEIDLSTAGPGGTPLSLRAVHPGQAADLSIVITPLTELATRKALAATVGLTAESINAANALVAKEFLGDEAFDITATVPVDVTDASSGSAAQPQKEYGLMLAAFSQAENNSDSTLGVLLDTYTTDLADDAFDNANKLTLNQALIEFINGPQNESGIGVDDTNLDDDIAPTNTPPKANDIVITDDNGSDVVVGDRLTGSYSYADLENDEEGSTTFRWLRGDVEVGSASTYVVTAEDSGADLVFEVTPIAAVGLNIEDKFPSDPISVINSAPVVSGVSVVDGNAGQAIAGDVLTGEYSYSDIDNDVEGVSTFRWFRGGTPIDGESSSTYVVTPIDSGFSIGFEVTPIAATGISSGVPVIVTGIIVNNLPPVANLVTITGGNAGVVVGDELAGSYEYADHEENPEGGSTFRWLRGDSEVGTALTYTVAVADSGATLVFEVTPVAVVGSSPGMAVASSGVGVNNSVPVATGVSITDTNGGDVVVGDLLTGAHVYSDIDNDAQGNSTFRWLRDGVAIAAAVDSTYTIVAEDSGSTLVFEVTPVASVGASPGLAKQASSGLAVANSAPVASDVSIADASGGTLVVGDTLTGGYTYADLDNDLEGVSTFRWLRDGVAIASATASDYVLVADDSGATLIFEVTPVADSGVAIGAPVESVGITAVNSAPEATDVNIVDDNGGDAVVGDTLTGNYAYADLDNDTEGTSTFRWLRDGVEVGVALTYTVVADDSGSTLTFEVMPVAVEGVSPGVVAVSPNLAIVNSAPVANGVSISDDNGGDALAGETLTASYLYSDVDGDLEGVSIFRWLRNGEAITNATELTYILVVADADAEIKFEVTPIAQTGEALSGSPVVSSGLGINNNAPVASVVTITDDNGGDIVVGDGLVGIYSYSDIEGDLQGTSTFRWLRNGVPIGAAVAATYTVVTADTGTTLAFEVVPVAATGTGVGIAVTSPTVTVTNSAPVASGVGILDGDGGNVVVGDSLTGVYSFTDVDGDTQGASIFRWLRTGVEIAGAVSVNYAVTVADVNESLTFEVTPVASDGVLTGESVISSAINVVNSAPIANAVNIIDSNGADPVVGDSLSGDYTYSDVDLDLQGPSTYRWLRNDTVIASTKDYTIVAADSGKILTFEVTPTAATGEITGVAVVSDGITVINSVPVALSVAISDDNGGDAVVGDVLTGQYVYSDLDNDAPGTSTYRWLRDDVVISAATALTYAVTAVDSGTTLKFEVTPVADSGITMGLAVVSAGITTVNSVPVASDVAIAGSTAGNAFVGDVLTGSYTYDDLDNDAEGSSTFRWLRSGVVIADATALTYTPVVDDLGSAIVFEVTPVADTGLASGISVASTGITIVNSVPVANGVTITDDNGGNAVVGDNLTGSYTYGDVDTDAEGATSFRWLRNGAPINEATSSAYIIVVGDVGAEITFEVTPLASTGVSPGEVVISAVINIANSAPVASGVAIIDDNGGNALVGDSLTGTYSYFDIDTDSEGATSFRWFRDSTEITDATDSTYIVVIADAGAIITFEVTPVANTGTLVGDAVTSAGLALFNGAPTATAVSIGEVNVGATVVGDTLVGSYIYSDLDNDAEGISTFRWLRGGVAISEATLSSYVVAAEDSGQTLTFEVTPIAAVGVTEGVAVVSTAGVTVVNSAPIATDVSIADGNGGSAVVGDELTGIYTYIDGDADAEGASTFRWLRNGSEISGATLTTYTVLPADSNTTLTFEVTPIAATGVAAGIKVVSTVGMAVVNSVPVASAVLISGDTAGNVVVGDILTATYDYSDIDEDSEGISTYRWLNNGSPILGATGLTYTVAATDNVVTLTFEVTPVADTGGVGALVGLPVVTSSGITLLNSIPVASDVVISGDSGGGAGVGTVLTGTYVYSDVDLDFEGDSTFRWLRDGSPLSGETAISYTTVAEDVGTTITFEVTPYAATGTGALVGALVLSEGIVVYTSPMVLGVARFLDVNTNGLIDSGDQLVVPFDQSVTVNVVGAGDFDLPVLGDSLGSGAVVAAGPASNEVTITLGSAPQLVTQDTFSVGTLAGSSPSGIDVAGAMTMDAIESPLTGIDAVASTPLDIIPTFSDSGQSLGTSDSRAIAVGDIDADGDIDIVVGNEAGQANKIYLNNGLGVFSDSGQSLGLSNTFGIALGDLDGDSDLDLVVGNHAQANRIFTNNSGVFMDTNQLIGLYGVNVDEVDLYGDTRAVALGDFNGDGHLDFVAVNESTTTHPNHVFMNDGNANFTDGATLSNLRASRAVAIGDIAGDGNLDFVVGNYSSWHDLYVGNGLGGFSSSSVVPISYPTRAIALGDVNGDGDLDVVVGNAGKINRVFINNGGSTGFTNSVQTWTVESGTNGVALIDVDGDGDLDMVTANYGQANLVYLNNGSGVFVDSGQTLGSNNSTAIAVGDFNDDGIDDLVISNDGQPNRVYFSSP